MANLIVDGLIEYSQAIIETKAEQFLRRRVDVPQRLPIDVELLLENSENVALETVDGILNNFSVEGCVCNEFMTRQLTVLVDSHIADQTDDARYNAVVAEELAHIELHMALVLQIKSIEDFIEARRHPKWRQIERDARLLSAAIRMPVSRVLSVAEQCYPQIIDDFGYREPSEVFKHLRNRLAEEFVVPVPEMDTRLKQWPCDLATRVTASVLARDENLAPIDATFQIQPPVIQRHFWNA